MPATLFATPVHQHSYLRQVLRAIDGLPASDVPKVIYRKGFAEYLYAFKNMNRTVVTGVCALPVAPGKPICAPGSFDLNKLHSKLTGACVYAPTYLRRHAVFGRDLKQEYFNVLFPFAARPPEFVSKATGDVYVEHMSVPFLILHISGADERPDSPDGQDGQDQGEAAPPEGDAPAPRALGETAQLLQLCALLYQPLQQAFLKRLPLFIHEQAVSEAAKLLLAHESFQQLAPFSRVSNGETHRGFLLLPERLRAAFEAVRAFLLAHQGKPLEGASPESLLSPRGGPCPSSLSSGPQAGLCCNFTQLFPVTLQGPGGRERPLAVLQVDTDEELGQLAEVVAGCVSDDRLLCALQPCAGLRRRLARELFASSARACARQGTVLAALEIPPVGQAWACGMNAVDSLRTYDAGCDAGAPPDRPPSAEADRTAGYVTHPAMRAEAYVVYCPPGSAHGWGNPVRLLSVLRRARVPGSLLRQVGRMDQEHADLLLDVERMFDIRLVGGLAPALDAGAGTQLLAHLARAADLGKAHVSLTATQEAQEGVMLAQGFRRRAVVTLDNRRSGALVKAYLLVREPRSPTALPPVSSENVLNSGPGAYTYSVQPPRGPGGRGARDGLGGEESGELVDQSAVSRATARGLNPEILPASRIVIKA